MKKMYVSPALEAVEISGETNVMLSASNGLGDILLEDGGEGDGADAGVKGITGTNSWDETW